ncbi:putative leader peptide [Streptomyces fructofermentans]
MGQAWSRDARAPTVEQVNMPRNGLTRRLHIDLLRVSSAY